MATKPSARIEQLEAEETALAGGTRIASATFGISVLQGLCVWFMAVGSAKLALGLGTVGAAGAASFIHSDPVRIPLMVVAVLGATMTLFVIWNQLRLRNNPAAQWRRKPLTTSEKRRIGFAVGASLLSYLLVIAEIFAHIYLHPA
jgi:hypothetical protein